MAMLSQCFSYYCCMESLGKLPPKRFGHHVVNVSAILRILFWGCQSRGVNLGRGGGQRLFRPPRDRRRQHTGRAATPATGLCRLFPVLSSLWRVCRNPLLLLPGPPNLCADAASRNQRQRSGTRQRRTKAAHRGKAATADNRPPAKLTGAKDQRKPCGALFANVVETGGAGRCTGIATPEPTSNSERRCVGQFGGRGSAPAARERLQRRTALPGRSASGARTGAGGEDL